MARTPTKTSESPNRFVFFFGSPPKAPEVLENLAKQGATPTPAGPGELGAQIAEETKRWATVVRDAGIKIE